MPFQLMMQNRNSDGRQNSYQNQKLLQETIIIILGQVVQSIVSLTTSLVNDSLSFLVHLKSSVLIFFAEKMRGAPHIFSEKNGSVFMYNMYEILTLH